MDNKETVDMLSKVILEDNKLNLCSNKSVQIAHDKVIGFGFDSYIGWKWSALLSEKKPKLGDASNVVSRPAINAKS